MSSGVGFHVIAGVGFHVIAVVGFHVTSGVERWERQIQNSLYKSQGKTENANPII